MALIIAGERSGVGKTTVTLALLSYLSKCNYKIQSFKVGPDYIDPMFHQRVTGRPCRNLDPVLTCEDYVKECFYRHCQGVDYALIEGVMGLFDGASGKDDFASTAHVARLLDVPVLLVLDCSRLSRSVAAIAYGYQSLDPRITIAGVVLNRVGSSRHLELLKDALEPLHIPVLGELQRQDNITIPDRHLGLIPTAEITQLDALINRLADLGQSCFNWEHLDSELKVSRLQVVREAWPIGQGFSELKVNRLELNSELNVGRLEVVRVRAAEAFGHATRTALPKAWPIGQGSLDNLQPNNLQPVTSNNLQPVTSTNLQPNNPQPVTSTNQQPVTSTNQQPALIRIAVACDRAFSFYYQDNLDSLEQLGAELVYWSPLTDTTLPPDLQGMYFGGGFPEVFAQQLAANTSARESVRTAIESGMPTYAECGGLMYLGEQITDFDGKSWSMVGVLPTVTVMGKSLTLGYRQATALVDGPLLPAGATVWGHEFHRSHLTVMPSNPLFELRGYHQRKVGVEGWQLYQLHASYVHLHWGSCLEVPLGFLQRCQQFTFEGMTS
ncbi:MULTISPECIES: cobyrinate a,c-diamide synthase [Moorena]|uniref:Cobyrinate a,c-diamide synthase n=1 Tax=Moorena producens 3L TaxID=489825 RepID=F4XYH7_9CYAN|nr:MULTISPECIES: cobyrinate a,c-diamide synthase [Moorena]EGJ30390.1 glutamine-hydrolysing, hydrogenobyrinic acid a,c-diamide synthase [Moorena producens 3L]NEP32492.1 cobyrinate a,c-diamide synthase [Moorena sp. SIO3B2]NEP68097.1 cobyrinate a,c-diamide synthase [Moorena sp. SIO3A5]NEQ07570.1 cobyrinate a,c-diamide synthase [Moorena sp. SIO4E2]NER89979.1 cobyrinate a,c-diamide synthase [Moorena sp. SIO3A2]